MIGLGINIDIDNIKIEDIKEQINDIEATHGTKPKDFMYRIKLDTLKRLLEIKETK
jgi:hypothetical protein